MYTYLFGCVHKALRTLYAIFVRMQIWLAKRSILGSCSLKYVDRHIDQLYQCQVATPLIERQEFGNLRDHVAFSGCMTAASTDHLSSATNCIDTNALILNSPMRKRNRTDEHQLANRIGRISAPTGFLVEQNETFYMVNRFLFADSIRLSFFLCVFLMSCRRVR